MIYNLTVLDGITKIEVDFSDEGVNLQGETFIKGGETKAENYVHIFEEDLRYNFADLFPKPEPEPTEEEMMV